MKEFKVTSLAKKINIKPQEVTIRYLRRKGELEIFEHQPRLATVRALGQARILTVDKKSLVRRIHEDPSLAYFMMQTMSDRIRELSTEVARCEHHQQSGVSDRLNGTDPRFRIESVPQRTEF